MAIYFSIAALVVVLAVLGQYNHNAYAKRRKPGERIPERRLATSYFDLVAAAVLVVFAGLRYEVGTDYGTYYRIYEGLDTEDWGAAIDGASQEAGYTLLMLVLKSFTESPHAIFWASAALTVIPIYAVLVRRAASPPLAVALFVLLIYVSSFNLIRQSVAIALFFWAWTFIDRRKVLFFAIVAVAATIHVSVVFAAALLLIARVLKWSWGTVAALGAAAVVAGLTAGQTAFINELVARFNPRYGGYFESGETGLGAYLQILAFIALLILAVSINSRGRPLTDSDKQLAVLSLVGIALMLAGTQAVVIFRMSGYFSLFLVLLVANRVAVSKDSTTVGYLLALVSSAYYAAHLANYGGVLPYQTYTSF